VLFIGMNHPFSALPMNVVASHVIVVGVIESRRAGQVNHSPGVLRAFARKRQVPFHVLDGRDASPAAFVESCRPDVICVAGMAQLLRADVLSFPRLGAVNLHPSLLPKYRGPSPFLWQYHEMDLDGGVTVHQIDEGLDSGDILVQRPLTISLGERYTSYERRCAEAGAEALVDAIAQLADGGAEPRPQRDLLCPLFARMMKPGERLIDWNGWPIERAWHVLHGLHGRYTLLPPPARKRARWEIGEIDRTPGSESPGTISRDGAGYFVAHLQGQIRLTLIPPPGVVRRVVRRLRQRLNGLR
jgi:methionyl-tRNA formyltransferase